jgi:Phage integrase, N-terminal SAM-like domain
MTSLEASLTDYLDAKRLDLRPNTHQQLSLRVGRFARFLQKAGVDSPEKITRGHITQYREQLQRFADSTQRQQLMNIKAWLRDLDRDDLARKIPAVKMTAEGNKRRKPRPFSDAEIAAFLRVAKPRVGLFFRTQLATGLAISDMVRLTQENLKDRCIEIARQKTGKPVRVKIADGLYQQLEVVLPFWEGDRENGVQFWSRKLRNTMCRADIYTRGALTHRCRDSFVDRHLAAGTPIAVIAASLGDLISTLEKHYASLDSMRMRQQIQQAPVIEIPVTI